MRTRTIEAVHIGGTASGKYTRTKAVAIAAASDPECWHVREADQDGERTGFLVPGDRGGWTAYAYTEPHASDAIRGAAFSVPFMDAVKAMLGGLPYGFEYYRIAEQKPDAEPCGLRDCDCHLAR